MLPAHDLEWRMLRRKMAAECAAADDVTVVRRADLENHNKDGGQWVVIEGKVYDLRAFRTLRSTHQDLTGISLVGCIMIMI